MIPELETNCLDFPTFSSYVKPWHKNLRITQTSLIAVIISWLALILNHEKQDQLTNAMQWMENLSLLVNKKDM